MNKQSKNQLSRRGFLGSAATVAALSVVPLTYSCSSSESSSDSSSVPDEDGNLNSKFAGVQCGTITYSFKEGAGVEDTINNCIIAGVSSIELMSQGIETYLGAPENPIQRGGFGGPMPRGPMPGGGAPGRGGMPGGGGPGRMQQQELTDEEKVLQAKYNEEIAVWRNDPATLKKWEELAKKFKGAGIEVHILKYEGASTDDEYDYAFAAAKAMGAVGITTELSEESCKTFGTHAERNGMLAIYHNHGQYASMAVEEIEKWLSYSPANRLNLDIGHYYGFGFNNSTGLNPIEMIDRFSDKIVSVHFKDKTAIDNETESNQNQVWGQGETPIREILKHIRDNYPHFYCDVELEYSIAAWSNSAKEVGKCIRYMREALI